MAEIRSPNVVALMNATKTTRSYYLAMELCNGKDLENFVQQRGGYLKEQEARLILCQIVEGMTAIKAKDVMHRDLKLPNIMMNFSDLKQNIVADPEFSGFDLNYYIRHFDYEKKHSTVTCKIADLGFARKLEEDQLAATNCGTPLMMAPEVLTN